MSKKVFRLPFLDSRPFYEPPAGVRSDGAVTATVPIEYVSYEQNIRETTMGTSRDRPPPYRFLIITSTTSALHYSITVNQQPKFASTCFSKTRNMLLQKCSLTKRDMLQPKCHPRCTNSNKNKQKNYGSGRIPPP